MSRFPPCPLCGHRSIAIHERIDSGDLCTLYRDLGVDVGRLLPSTGLVYGVCRACALGFFLPSIEGDELFYADLQKQSWYFESNRQEHRLVVQHIRPGETVVEVGSGDGRLGRLLPSNRYVGLDTSPYAVAEGVARGIDIRAQTIEEHTREFPGSADVICAFQVLEHVSRPAEFLRGCVNALRPGGLMAVAVPCRDGFLGRAVNVSLDLPPHHVTRWTIRTLRHVAAMFGLAPVRLWHEPLQEVHRAWYANVILSDWIAGWLRHPRRLVDRTAVRRRIDRVASRIARPVGSRVHPRGPRGHTVVALYRRP